MDSNKASLNKPRIGAIEQLNILEHKTGAVGRALAPMFRRAYVRCAVEHFRDIFLNVIEWEMKGGWHSDGVFEAD